MADEKIIMNKTDYHAIRDGIKSIRGYIKPQFTVENDLDEIEDLLDKAEPFEKYVLNIYKKSSVGDE